MIGLVITVVYVLAPIVILIWLWRDIRRIFRP